MKKKILLIPLALLLAMSLMAMGCPAPTPAPPPAPAPTGKTLSETLGMAANIVSVKYDMLMTSPGMPAITTTVWVKKNKMRTEMTQQGMNIVMLLDMDAKTMYSYMPAQNLAMKIPFDPGQAPEAATDEAQSILNYNPNVVGTESIDGKACLVVEYISGGISMKTWIWEDKGLPLRIEMITGADKTVIEYKNYDFSDIPDSMFELPSGVQVM